MRLSGLKLIATGFLAALLSAPAWAANPALPGTVNYVEGQVSIGTEALNAKSVGSVNLETGQTITTETGKAEVLLTPGVFFRLGDNGAATMVSPSLTNTEMSLDKGQAMVEVDDIHKANLLRVQENGASTELLKTGIYGFDANSGQVRVFKGEALVQDGETQTKVKGGHELTVQNTNQTGKLKTIKFDENAYEQSDLYRFSDLRSEYLAEANVNAASLYYPGGAGWIGAGWYWDPWFFGYTWLPGDGWFAGPFGWGFYSPLWFGYGPYYHPYYGAPYAAGHPLRPVHGPWNAAHPGEVGFRGPSSAAVGTSHFGVMGEGFHGGTIASGGFHSSGFSGGGGGFHR